MAKQVDCTECAFMIRDENEEELVDLTQQHASNAHGTSPSDDDVRSWMTEA